MERARLTRRQQILVVLGAFVWALRFLVVAALGYGIGSLVGHPALTAISVVVVAWAAEELLFWRVRRRDEPDNL